VHAYVRASICVWPPDSSKPCRSWVRANAQTMIEEALLITAGSGDLTRDGEPGGQWGAFPGPARVRAACGGDGRARDADRDGFKNDCERECVKLEGEGVGVEAVDGEGSQVQVTWVEAAKTKGAAVVCSCPQQKVAVVVVRGTVNLRNVLLALKLWPSYSSDPALGMRLHSGFAQVAGKNRWRMSCCMSSLCGPLARGTRAPRAQGGADTIYRSVCVMPCGSAGWLWMTWFEKCENWWGGAALCCACVACLCDSPLPAP
jgi:hypothetical protein